MLMRPSNGGVDRDHPLQVRDRVRLTLQLDEHPVPGAVLGPPVEPPPDRLPGREIGRQIPPRRPGPKPPTDRLDHRPVVTPPPAAPEGTGPAATAQFEPTSHRSTPKHASWPQASRACPPQSVRHALVPASGSAYGNNLLPLNLPPRAAARARSCR